MYRKADLERFQRETESYRRLHAKRTNRSVMCPIVTSHIAKSVQCLEAAVSGQGWHKKQRPLSRPRTSMSSGERKQVRRNSASQVNETESQMSSMYAKEQETGLSSAS